MAWRERNRPWTVQPVRAAKSAGFRKNPRKHEGTVAIRRKKAPTENSWGFNSGGGAVSGKSEYAAKNRDDLAAKMTPAQIAEAQKLARECQARKFKGC